MFRMLLLKDDIFRLRHKQLNYIRNYDEHYMSMCIHNLMLHCTIRVDCGTHYSTRDSLSGPTLYTFSCLIEDNT